MTVPMGWWTISGEVLLEALQRAHAGEEPDLVYAELYANSDIERPGHELPDDEPDDEDES